MHHGPEGTRRGRQTMVRAKLLIAGPLAAYAAPGAVAYLPIARLVGVRRSIRRIHDVAITLDDGPQTGATEHFLELLERVGLRVTFFLVGEQVVRFPQLVRAIQAGGHEIGNHGYRHRNHFLRSPLRLMDDVRYGADAIESVTGERPPLFRPPQGAVTAATLAAARREGAEIVLWSAWGRDWRPTATADSIVHDAVRRARGGQILLLHDADYYSGRTWHATYDALPRIVTELRGQGLRPGRIGGRAELA